MRVYTRTGDKGTTSLASGTRVPKYDKRLEAYGTIDELNSFIGSTESLVMDQDIKTILNRVQNRLFTISSNLAMDMEEYKENLPKITTEDIAELESEIDRMLDLLPPLKNFILPGGHPATASCHISRTVCRRAERLMVELAETVSIENNHIVYVNRLSDYLFVAARKTTQDFGMEDKIWYSNNQEKGF
jgi:cob(I)alamin adenosyltransferase